MVEVAPGELAAKCVGSLAARQALLDLARREAAHVQIGGEARSLVFAERVAVRPVSPHVGREEATQSLATRALAARQGLGDLLLEPELLQPG